MEKISIENAPNAKNINYHFPILIHSSGFVNRSELDEEETELLSIQLTFLSGDYNKTIKDGKVLFEKTTSSAIKIGIGYFIAISLMLLGIYTECKSVIGTIDELAEAETEHQEDFRLIVADAKFTIIWDSTLFKALNLNKMSPDAISFYQMSIITDSVIRTEPEPDSAISVFASICATAEVNGILPTSLQINAMLATQYCKVARYDAANECVKKICDIAIENGWIKHLSKYYFALSSPINEYLSKVKPDAIDLLQTTSSKNLSNWNIIKKAELGFSWFAPLDINQSEIFLLCAYDISDEEISVIVGKPIEEIEKAIQSFCNQLSLSGREKLVEFAKLQLDGMVL